VTDAAFILSVLADGQKHSQADLLRRSFEERGHGLTVHSRVADLRGKGHYIVCERVPGADRGHAWVYQLVASPSESDLSVDASPDGKLHDRTDGRSGSEGEGEQAPLFNLPKAPAWH
jgi:hypothetical protein